MKLTYFPDTDTLYIDLADRPSAESEVLNDNLIIDLDDAGRPVGITVAKIPIHSSTPSLIHLLPQTPRKTPSGQRG